MIQDFLNLAFLFSILRMSTPLIFTSLGGLISERSGVVNIALEGHMLIGAFVAASIASVSSSVWLGWMAAGIAGIFLAGIYAYFVIELEGEPVVAGTALNLLTMGAIPLASKIFFNTTGSTPALTNEVHFYFEPIVMAVLIAFVMHIWISQTASGLWVSFAGRKPQALAPQGIHLKKVRWFSVLACGLLAAWGGASLSLFLASSYSPLMSGGRGFMSLAALIFGQWMPLQTLGASLFFGFTEALQIRLQGVEMGTLKIPVQFFQMIPYVVTLVVLFKPFRRNSK